VRGDLMLHVRMLARPHGVVGLVWVLAGTGALAACYLPWYEVSATLGLLGTSGRRTVATMAMWEAHPWGWIGPTLAVVVIVGGVALAVDRALPAPAMTLAGIGLGATVALGTLAFPSVARFDVAGTRLRELASAADRLPRDVDLTFGVHPSTGLWLMLGAALTTLAAAFAARERGMP
jgi:hypothetical protein